MKHKFPELQQAVHEHSEFHAAQSLKYPLLDITKLSQSIPSAGELQVAQSATRFPPAVYGILYSALIAFAGTRTPKRHTTRLRHLA